MNWPKWIDLSWPRCYFKFVWTTKIIWSWWHCFSSLLTCKSGTQGSSSNRCRYCWKDRPKCLRKVVATGPYVNFFLDKSKISDQVIKSVIEVGQTTVNKTKVMAKTLPSTFQVQISQNHSQLVTCVQPLSGMLFQTSSAKWATTRLKSTTWGLG